MVVVAEEEDTTGLEVSSLDGSFINRDERKEDLLWSTPPRGCCCCCTEDGALPRLFRSTILLCVFLSSLLIGGSWFFFSLAAAAALAWSSFLSLFQQCNTTAIRISLFLDCLFPKRLFLVCLCLCCNRETWWQSLSLCGLLLGGKQKYR